MKGSKAFSTIIGALFAVVGMSTAAVADPSTRIGIVAPGPHPYFTQWEPAGQQAAKDFNIGVVDYRVPNKWELAAHNALLESMASQNYNAFLIFPGDPVATRPTVADLVGMGAPVISLAGCLQDPSDASFCFATDNTAAAYEAAKLLIKEMGGKGKIVHFAGFMTDPNTKVRIDAIARAVAETNGAVTVVDNITDLDVPEAAQDKINAFLATQGSNVDGIITTAWIPSVVAATALRKIGDRRIKMIGLDNDDLLMAAIKDGYVSGTVVENAFAQAYVGSFAVDKLHTGCTLRSDAPWKNANRSAKLMDSGTVYVTAANLDTYHDIQKEKAKELLTSFKSDYLKCP
jgi:ribose transport system substrate-binding protein